MNAYLVGGGLASLAAAAYLIKDGGFSGDNITIYEATEHLGGCLYCAGRPELGYIYPAAHVFERQYRCALDLFSFIPSRSDPRKSVAVEIREFSKRVPIDDVARLVNEHGQIIDTRHLRLGVRDKIDLMKLLLTPERSLDGKAIGECLSSSFFQTDFWYAWSSLMAFLPDHSAIEARKYMIRFFHLIPDIATMSFCYRTPLNEYQCIVEPLSKWLKDHGVIFVTNAFVSDISFQQTSDRVTANALEIGHGENAIKIGQHELVFITNGSQFSDHAIGSMTAPPKSEPARNGTSWMLWKTVAQRRPDFGRPEAFSNHTDQSTLVSFTVTGTTPIFAKLMEDFSRREAGRGGLMTFKRSNWLISIAVFQQPIFVEQSREVYILWGYSYSPHNLGNFVGKSMTQCSGTEILYEVLKHLKFDTHLGDITNSSICIPCLMPYANSVMLRRKRADRPLIVPEGSTNFAFVGQFCEQSDDVVFTIEYSVRSAMTAVYKLLNLDKQPPPVYKGWRDPRVVYRVFKALT